MLRRNRSFTILCYIEFLQGEWSGVTLHAKQENEFDVFTPEFLIRGAAIEIEEEASIQDPLFYALIGQMFYMVGS